MFVIKIQTYLYYGLVMDTMKLYCRQGWIKCGSGEHRSQEMARKIEEIITMGYEEKEKRQEEEKEKREEEEREEEEKKKRRKEKKKR